jgi:hypothetical protein
MVLKTFITFFRQKSILFTDLLDLSRDHSVVSERKGTQFTKICCCGGYLTKIFKKVSDRKLWF